MFLVQLLSLSFFSLFFFFSLARSFTFRHIVASTFINAGPAAADYDDEREARKRARGTGDDASMNRDAVGRV